jgi:hypothetical protein
MRTIGDRNDDVREGLQRLKDALVMDERDTSRESLLVLIPMSGDEDVQVFQNGIEAKLELGLSAEDLISGAFLKRLAGSPH